VSAQDTTPPQVRGCAAEAGEFLDPHWAPRRVAGTYPAKDGVEAVIRAQGTQVTVTCNMVSGYGAHILGDVATIEGVEPAPGQLYLPAQHRWLTDAELHARLATLLGPRPGEYAGAAWAPNEPGVYRVSDLAGAPSTACFTLQSRLEPARQLVACEVPAGHRFWVSQALLTLELNSPPSGLPAIPPAPPTDWATQPGGAPR
jgi:hypothetical protein